MSHKSGDITLAFFDLKMANLTCQVANLRLGGFIFKLLYFPNECEISLLKSSFVLSFDSNNNDFKNDNKKIEIIKIIKI